MIARGTIHVALCVASRVLLSVATQVAVSIAIALAIAAHARAASELELTWPEHESCPTQSAIEDRIREQLGRNLANVERGLSAVVTIRHDARGYELALSTAHGEQRGRRTFQAKSCDEVSEAAVLLLVLSLEERRAAAVPEAAPGQPAVQRARPVGLALAAAANLDFGTLPNLSVGPELGFSLGLSRWRVELSGFYLPPSQSPSRESASVRVALGGGRAKFCQDLVGTRVGLAGCAGLELGVASGKGIGLETPRTERFVWRAAILGVRMTARVGGGFALFAEPGLAIPLGRSRFLALGPDGALELHAPTAAAARGALGFQLTFR